MSCDVVENGPFLPSFSHSMRKLCFVSCSNNFSSTLNRHVRKKVKISKWFQAGRFHNNQVIDMKNVSLAQPQLSLATSLATDVVYLDFSRAFETISTRRQMDKCSHYGITDSNLSWLKSFLTNRTCSVRLSDVISKPLNVTSGVPQISVPYLHRNSVVVDRVKK